MAKFNQSRPQQPQTPSAPVNPEVQPEKETHVDSAVMQSAVLDNKHTPETAQSLPVDKPSEEDAPTSKDHLIHDSTYRRGGKRRFMTDLLCRTLDCEHYVGNAEKRWGHNPLGGMPVVVTFTREFPTKFILFDHYDSATEAKIIEFKKNLCNKHGFKYLYETPEKLLDHNELNRQLDEQKDVKPPQFAE